jgi:serine/threonine-protein kinase
MSSGTAAVAQQPSIGAVRDYVVVDAVGRGAHGTVYRAHPRGRPEERVALKVIEDTASIDRLLVEPHLLSKLRHANIIGLRDYFLHGGKLVLVTEYIDGPDLATYLEERGRFSAPEVRAFLEQMADAVAHAHAAGVFHSDLKPSNILVDRSGPSPRYVIVDFGVSRMANAIQRVKHVAGTCSFMAPEQLRGRGGTQSDLWALGTIAYTLIAGAQPFPARTMDELRRQILFEQPAFPPDLARDDAVLERTIVRLLEKSVVDRTPTATALRRALAGDDAVERRDLADVPLAHAITWEEALLTEVRRRRRDTVVWALVACLPAVIPDVLGCVGAWLIFKGQTRRRTLLTIAGLASTVAAFFAGAAVGIVLGDGADAIVTIGLLFGLANLVAAGNFVALRRAEREHTLVRTLRMGRREDVLSTLHEYVSAAPSDMGIRRRFMEALLASGRAVEAAVEAKLALEVDPYNLAVTLVLANAYLELGLHERCEQVCNGYLEIAGQCFEFEELRAAARRRQRG